MYNCLYKSLIGNEILYPKQFGFQNGHSTDHPVVQLVAQIVESFENNKYTLGVFIDLPKAFDTVDHSILLKKIGTIWYNRQQSWMGQKLPLKSMKKKKTSLETISCGVPQGSILGPLLLFLYVSDLKNTSNILDPIMFADDSNLFFTQKDIRYLFQIVNQELENINQWFVSNKLSLNIRKKTTKYSFFYKTSQKKTFHFFYQNS